LMTEEIIFFRMDPSVPFQPDTLLTPSAHYQHADLDPVEGS
jgi:hypothetical protein